jgi:hypothetical protein
MLSHVARRWQDVTALIAMGDQRPVDVLSHVEWRTPQHVDRQLG